jgi:hypothetical protein
VGVGQPVEGGRQRWCRFNASVLAREGRQWDEALSEDEAEAASSFWLNGKEVLHGMTAWQHRPEERRHQGGERVETMPVRLMRILLCRKMKKILAVNSAVTNGR